MTEVKTPVTNWLTGRNVPTLHPEQGLVGTKGESPGDMATPAKSAPKEEWYAYRRSQGFNEDDLKGLSKQKLIDYEGAEAEESEEDSDEA